MERNDKRLLVALASALGCALLAIAFLLGRVSSKRDGPLPAAALEPALNSSVTDSSSPATRPVPGGPGASSHSGETPSPPVTAATTSVPPGRSPVTNLAPTSGAMASVERQQIASYFAEVERLEELGGDDPQAFANSMLQSVSSGDFSGFDDLLAKARDQRQRLLPITPPPACLDHHRLALMLSGDSVTMLERLKAALVKGDTTALMTMATEGRALERQANQLKSMGEAIKRQAGLP